MQDNPLIAALNYFRSLNFFTDRAGMSDMDLAVQLGYDVTETRAQWGTPDDIMLLANDHARVWWEDSAAGVAAGARVYEKTLQDWASISRGALDLQSASEFWGAAEGPVWIKAGFGSEVERLRPEVIEGGRLDFSILSDLNRAVKSAGMEFCLLAPVDSMAFVVTLTPDERRRLGRERGWKFIAPRKFYDAAS